MLKLPQNLPHSPRHSPGQSPTEEEKPRCLLFLPSACKDSQDDAPDVLIWGPLKSWEMLVHSVLSDDGAGKGKCLFLTLLPLSQCPNDLSDTTCHFPSMPTFIPGPHTVTSARAWTWEGRKCPMTSLPGLTPMGSGLSAPKPGSKTLSRDNF